jgi:ankyrin repeat protein
MEDIEAGSGSELEDEEPPPPPPEPTILEALHANDLDAVEAAIRRGEDMEQTDPERDHATPLILSVQKNMVELAENLIVRSAAVNARKGNGDTALHWACYKGNVRLVKALLAAGADIVRVPCLYKCLVISILSLFIIVFGNFHERKRLRQAKILKALIVLTFRT